MKLQVTFKGRSPAAFLLRNKRFSVHEASTVKDIFDQTVFFTKYQILPMRSNEFPLSCKKPTENTNITFTTINYTTLTITKTEQTTNKHKNKKIHIYKHIQYRFQLLSRYKPKLAFQFPGKHNDLSAGCGYPGGPGVPGAFLACLL